MPSTTFPRALHCVFTTLLFLLLLQPARAIETEEFKVLVFTKTAGYRHPSITQGIQAIQKLGRDRAGHEATIELTGVYHNLLRRWAEV